MSKLTSKTLEELKQIAMDIYDQKIFIDRYCTSPEEVGMVFMVIMLGGLSDKDEEYRNDIGLIYEYYSEAGPRGINGKPCFTSLKLLSKADTTIMFDYYNEYKELKDKFAKS